jgi:hypothetical protein
MGVNEREGGVKKMQSYYKQIISFETGKMRFKAYYLKENEGL